MDTKKFCKTHHFFYHGVECPLCLKERVAKMTVCHKNNDNNPKEATETDIQKLLDKFNTKCY